MHKSKYALASAVSGSCCTLLYGYSNQNEMLGAKELQTYNFAEDGILSTFEHTKENAFTNHIVENSQVKEMLQKYRPSWFYGNSLVGNCAGMLIVPQKEMPEHETVKVQGRSS